MPEGWTGRLTERFLSQYNNSAPRVIEEVWTRHFRRGPAPKTQVEIGLIRKDAAATLRLDALPLGGMCQYRVRLSDPSEVDAELVAWIRRSYDAAS